MTKRYVGGTARKIWKFVDGAPEAEALTADYPGGSHTPMWWEDRVYFITDRDGTMNVWSMDEGGSDLRQHTHHSGWDVRDANLHNGRVVYQSGADLWLYDIGADQTRALSITLSSDFDQLRERWVKKPMQYLTSVHIHPKGESVVMTARGRIFVAPAKQGRRLRASPKAGVRYRDGVFMPDGDNVLVLSDETGEFEFVTLPADGVGDEIALSDDGTILRYQGIPSPDGAWVAYDDNNRDMWLLNVESGEQKVISTNRQGIGDFAWSPDSRWIAFSQQATNTFAQIYLYNVESGSLTPLTSDRFNSGYAVWSPDGQWIYFLSDRNLQSVVGSPWGPRQPEPYFDKPMKLYQVSLQADLRPPFQPVDELHSDKEGEGNGKEKNGDDDAVTPIRDRAGWDPATGVGGAHRTRGTTGASSVNEKALFWICSRPRARREVAPDGRRDQQQEGRGEEDRRGCPLVRDVGRREEDPGQEGRRSLCDRRRGQGTSPSWPITRWISMVGRLPSMFARTGARSSSMPGGWSVTTFTTPGCTGSTGTGFVINTCRSSTE